MLQRKDAEIIVDRKDFNGDKFDDLKVKLSNGITEFQIKYSDEESSHNLTKSDLSNGNGHDTALYDLFASWKTRKESKNNTEIKLCLAWGRPADDDPIAKFLKPIQEHTMPFSTVAYSFDGAAFWPAEDTPPKTWKKFNLKIKSEPIEREDFLAFCNELTFILEMPKASLDLKKPGDIENVIIQQVEKLGVGIYPNDNLRVEDVIGKLAMEVKHSRAIGNKLYTNVLMGRLGLIADYGKFDQRFPVDSAHQIILTKIHNNRTVNALCGADFYLSSDDLMEITGDGEFVEHDISVLQPLLIENISNGGFSIYHESFRRFVLALLKEKKVDLERNVYGILADWLQEKPFFEFNRSFYYLTELLYKIKRDTENTALIEKKFVLKSVSEGYSRKYIRKNLNCIIRSAGRSENLVALVIAGELLAMLDDLNEFESTGEEYLQAISDIKGASKLNQLMQIDGEPTFEKDTGQLACYISSKAGVKPWWELYLDTDTKQVEIENFKYYLRYNLDEQGVSIIPDLMETIEKDDVSVRNECIEIAYDELRDYIENTEIASIAENRQLMHWKRYLSYIENGYYPQTGVSFEDTIGNWEKIRKLKMPGEEDVRIFKEFFSQIYYLAKQENKKAIETILGDCGNINWFYNWIIYSVKMAELCARTAQMDSRSICELALGKLNLTKRVLL